MSIQFEPCSPAVDSRGFESWLMTTLASAWAVGELGRPAKTKDEVDWVLKRVGELEKEARKGS